MVNSYERMMYMINIGMHCPYLFFRFLYLTNDDERKQHLIIVQPINPGSIHLPFFVKVYFKISNSFSDMLYNGIALISAEHYVRCPCTVDVDVHFK